MVCTTACVTDLDIPNLLDICGEVLTREEMPSKLVLFRCDVAIPSGSAAAIAAALEALITAGTMGVTGKLKNFTWGDPTTTDQSFADCHPLSPNITGRSLSFEDYNAIDLAEDGTTPSPYRDRDFWKYVNDSKKWNYGWTTCDGLLYLAKNKAGTAFETGIGQIFQTEDRSQTNKIIEVKRGTVNFLSDPKSFVKPYLDLTTYPALAGLY